MTIILNDKIIAINYAPKNPPPVWMCWDWIRLSGSHYTTSELKNELRTGKPVTLGDGLTLEWRNDENS